MNNGYIEVLARGSRTSRKSGWVYEHRLVAEAILGRPLKRSEVVHHIDEIRTNNTPDNLIVFATDADHGRYHKCGVAFRRQDGAFESLNVPCNRCLKCLRPCENKYCGRSCNNISKRKFVVDRERLAQLIASNSMREVGRMFGVSDNAIRRRAKTLGLLT